MVTSEVVRLSGVSRTFTRGRQSVRAVVDVDLSVRSGEIVALVGASGSGKSTLLSLVVGWERPDTGAVVVNGASSGDPAVQHWRDIAIIPQALGLLEDLSLRDNITLPARATRHVDATYIACRALAERLGIAELLDRYPSQTSLGQQQRACLARALIGSPSLVVADEPTAHQDPAGADTMLDVMRAAASRGAALLIATHTAALTEAADRVVMMRDGRIFQLTQ